MTRKSVFDSLGNKPPIAELVGWELVDFSEEERWARVSFNGKKDFANPAGFIQGGILSTMLDEVMGSAVIIATKAEFLTTTISLSVDFIKPVPLGLVTGIGHVTSLKKSIAFVEGKLIDEDEQTLCRAVASCKLIPMPGGS